MIGALEFPAIVAATLSLSETPRLGAACSSSSLGSTSANSDDFLPRKTSTNSHFLSLPKPSLLVRTQSNVRKERRRKPEPSCVVCDGTGRVDCHQCQGRGRTNYTNLTMLPKGEWPKWCKTCGGSGLGYCPRCLGTGEYRDIMGFHFMKREANNPPKQTSGQFDRNTEPLTAADLLLSETSAENEQQ
ncbi:Chaperone protein DnaJ [Bienertia sinuspersici]